MTSDAISSTITDSSRPRTPPQGVGPIHGTNFAQGRAMPHSTSHLGPHPARTFTPAWVDVVFKRLLGEHPKLLRAMLHAVLAFPQPIVDCEILDSALGDENADSKDIRLDLLVRLADRTHVNVEMQSTTPPGVTERLLYYWARMHSVAIRRGGGYLPAPRSISILWSRRELFRSPDFHHRFRILNQHGRPFSDGLAIHVLELSHLDVAEAEGASPDVIRWARLLLAESEGELQDLAREDLIMRDASFALKDLQVDPDFRSIAELRRDAAICFLLEKAAAHEAGLEMGKELGLAQGREIGLEQGREIGLEQGREIGLEQGRELGFGEGLRRGLAVQRKLLIDILELRFGALLDDRRAAVLSATADDVARWTAVAASAPSLDEVFTAT